MTDQSAEGKIRFAGPALAEGAMDARDFASAVVGLADLVEASAVTLYGTEVRSRVMLNSGFKRGSFIADFEVQIDGALQVSAFQTEGESTGAPELLQAIGVQPSTTPSVVGLNRALKSRQPEERTELDDGMVEVRAEGCDPVVVSRDVLALYEADGVKRALYSMTKPLERDGVTEVQFRHGRSVVERIQSKELPHLEAAAKHLRKSANRPSPEPPTESEDVITVDLLQGVFSERESFRFFDGENKFYARITDQEWWERIHHGLDGYFEGDRMKVTIVSRQGVDGRGRLLREQEVVKVLRHQHRPRQGDLFA
ncbi:hypothetical protein [Gaopeijia maritima]|uniref:Uncharacterized protein n=1 Tax=Gaopeijia maritima TaxID=3119007 RepID=A0ABU9ED15_9BACT